MGVHCVLESLPDWNPWWTGNTEALKKLSGVPRPSYPQVTASLKQKEVTVLTGVRRSGKSTLMYQMVSELLKTRDSKQVLFANFDDESLQRGGLDNVFSDYRTFINPDKPAYVFLDEIERVTGWEKWMKKQYDLQTGAKFVVSGSSASLLKKEYATLLSGRNLTFEIMPLSFAEYLSFAHSGVKASDAEEGLLSAQDKARVLAAVDGYLEYGGFPEIAFKEDEFKKITLKQYFDDIVYKDIIARHDIKGNKPRDLAFYLATNTGAHISLRAIRTTLGLAYETTQQYVDYFKEARLFLDLEHFSYSLKEQKTRASKIYCIDTGLRNAVAFKFSRDFGKLAENTVRAELARRGLEAYYWKGKHEVDFIVKHHGNELDAINVSYADEFDERETAGLHEARDALKTRDSIILTKNTQKQEESITYIPLWKWLLQKEGG